MDIDTEAFQREVKIIVVTEHSPGAKRCAKGSADVLSE